jgi:hypothetical protein
MHRSPNRTAQVHVASQLQPQMEVLPSNASWHKLPTNIKVYEDILCVCIVCYSEEAFVGDWAHSGPLFCKTDATQRAVDALTHRGLGCITSVASS